MSEQNPRRNVTLAGNSRHPSLHRSTDPVSARLTWDRRLACLRANCDMTLIRPQQRADRAAVRAVLTAAFAVSHVADLAEALLDGPARLSLVATADEQIVGHTMLSRGWVDAAERLVEVLILSPLAVIPSHQRRGIGGTLVRSAVAGAEHAGSPLVFLEGAPDYYSRFGFVPGGEQGFARPSLRIPAAAFQVAVLPAWQPWMIGTLVYPDAFWALDCVGLRS